MNCPTCGHQNLDGVKFCNECGAEIRTEILCPKCGRKNPQNSKFCNECGQPFTTIQAPPTQQTVKTEQTLPTSFAAGRYVVKKFLGEGGKKKVYLAHDTVLDRDVAFALIKTEKLDDAGRTRIKREAQAMGRLGDHPNIVTVFDFGDQEGQPYMVLPLLSGGDVEGLIKKATDHRLSIDQSLEIARSVCKGLEFAHSKGIIHRDIKPGNVWLSTDGTAKVGDFGLAVAVDLSRLTQDGMMVGTVSYMPPEQAMGGQVAAASDLYSLGAMLYEMVTGRPPFVGDDSVAIIGQHLNTPPVSPAWHRADLSPALETLIMSLLEKDPSKRPASATVVLQTLELIAAGKAKEPSQESAKPASNPIYRRVFVGREPELKLLQAAFDSAMAGKGGLAVVVGEPGIGKTSLCEQLATYVQLRGGRSLVGHCYEKGSSSLPYLAFVEALRSYVLSRPPDDLKKEMGTGAADVARIISEVRERLKVEPRPAGDPEEERYRLLQAVTEFLVNASNIQPLLIILEDLHDADKGTLEMLTHISRHLQGARLFIVGTYRDVEVDRSHPLSSALAELRRISTFARVALRGLTADEVQRMLSNVVEQEVPWSLAEAVHRQTEGNPLFVQEVLRYLVEEGHLSPDKSGTLKVASQTSIATTIPEGLRDVIGKRLSRLSPNTNQVLAFAAVIGRDFNLVVLQKIVLVNEEELFSALEEATGAAVLEGRSAAGKGASFRFAHAFFRQTLYEELFAPRRIRTHQQVGRALEEVYANRLEEHAAELAAHFSQSTETSDLAKAVKYGEIAAKRAISVYAYSEAVRLYEECLKAQEVLDPDDKARICDLLLALGEAANLAGEPRRVVDEVTPKAFAFTRALGDDERAFRVSDLAGRGLRDWGQLPALLTAEGRLWAQRLDRFAKPDSIERAKADQTLGFIKFQEGQVKEARALFTNSLEVVRRLGDDAAFLEAAGNWLFAGSPREQAEERLRVADEMMQRPRAGIGERMLEIIDNRLMVLFFQLGQRSHVERLIADEMARAERTRQGNIRLSAVRYQAVTAMLDGRLGEAADIAQKLLTTAADLGLMDFVRVTLVNGPHRALLEVGSADLVLQVIQDISGPVSPNRASTIAICQAHLGRFTQVNEILDRTVLSDPDLGSTTDETAFSADVKLLEAATLSAHRHATEILLKRFAIGSSPPFTPQDWVCTYRILASAKSLVGRQKEARADYEKALKACTEFRFRPEIALTRLGLAELLLEHYPAEKKEALEHLDFAIKEFREMKMQPSLERALRHKEILKA